VSQKWVAVLSFIEERACLSVCDWTFASTNQVMPLMQGAILTILDAIYTNRHYARFYMLETIARVPYFGRFRNELDSFEVDAIMMSGGFYDHFKACWF
jgi:hypothetical protein